MLTPVDNPFDPQPSPSGAVIQNIDLDADIIHGHSPRFGGEIAWNDIQQIAAMNAMIRLGNQHMAQRVLVAADFLAYLEDEDKYYFPGKRPYVRSLDPSGYPQQGYNIHTHKNDYDGGFLYGVGPQYRFAVYHSGSDTPLRSYRIED